MPQEHRKRQESCLRRAVERQSLSRRVMKQDIEGSVALLSDKTREFYLESMRILDEAGVEFLVGGAYSLAHYAGVVRHTKDFDVFVRKTDLPRALGALE